MDVRKIVLESDFSAGLHVLRLDNILLNVLSKCYHNYSSRIAINTDMKGKVYLPDSLNKCFYFEFIKFKIFVIVALTR